MSEEINGVPIADDPKLKTYWRNEFARCEDMMDERRLVWRKARKNYRMGMYAKDEEDGSRSKRKKAYVRNPILYTNVSVLMANLAANKPQVTATARYRKDEITATMVGAALEYYFEKCDLFTMLKDGVLDASLANIGIAKIGYNLYSTYMFDGDSPFISRVSFLNFLVDADATGKKDPRWMGEKTYISANDLKDPNNKYMNVEDAMRFASTFRVNEEINEIETDDRMEGSFARSSNYDDEEYPYQPSLERRIPVIEIYDRVNRQILFFAGECDVLIKSMPYPKYIRDFPYAILQFNSIPDYFLGMTDFEIIADKIREINTINNRMIEHTKRMLPKLLSRKGVLNRNEIEKITDGKVGGVYEVDTPSSLGDVIIPLPTAPLDQSNIYVMEGLKRSLNEDTGIADFMKSQPFTEKRTATEMAMVQQAAGVRANYRQKAVDAWMEEIATKLFYVIKETLQAPVWIDIAGIYPMQAFDEKGVPFINTNLDTGEPVLNRQNGFWLTPTVLQSEFRIKIEAGSTAAQTSTVKQNQIMQAYSLFSQNPLVDQVALLRKTMTALGLEPDDLIKQQALAMQGGMGAPPPPPPVQPNGSTEVRPQETQMEGVMTGNQLAADMRGQ